MITEEQYRLAASLLHCEVAALKAVQKIETGGKGGFIDPEHPRILFEGQVFWQRLKKLKLDPTNFVKGNEDVLYPSWTKKFYKRSLEEYDRLNKAIQINETAALESASWGMFLIMGFNYKSCECETVQEFVEKMKESEYSQLMLSVKFILKHSNILKALLNKDWQTFAYHYNGPKYSESQYDVKLNKAYQSFK